LKLQPEKAKTNINESSYQRHFLMEPLAVFPTLTTARFHDYYAFRRFQTGISRGVNLAKKYGQFDYMHSPVSPAADQVRGHPHAGHRLV
jgi:hypothetical protein